MYAFGTPGTPYAPYAEGGGGAAAAPADAPADAAEPTSCLRSSGRETAGLTPAPAP